MKQTVLFPKNNLAWLAQFDCSTLLGEILELFGSAPVYIVDNRSTGALLEPRHGGIIRITPRGRGWKTVFA